MRPNPWLHSPIKRVIDVVVAGVALVVLAPLLAVVAIAVRFRLGSPVLFRQRRSGLDGAQIDVVKFRSMTDARTPDGTLLDDADRLTPFGARLRSTSLDELPQLWNVLRGDMSLVGPRPLPPAYDDRYSPEQRRRLDATPGITGWAQVQGRNALDWPTKLAHDVWYVDHASLRLDLTIVGRTLRAVVTRSGVSSDGHATMPEFLGGDG
jgi:lipopolysaccharide/colanic/teichoic acid biosynthesis glycosyltransferase